MADEILADAPEITSLTAAHYLLGLNASSDEARWLLNVFEDYAWGRFHPSVGSGKYVVAPLDGTTTTTTAALSANLATFVPFRIRRPTVISRLCARVVAAGGNIDMSIYAADLATGRPTGSEIRKTGSTAANAANTSVDGTPTGGNLTVDYSGNAGTVLPGIYFFGLNSDNASLTVRGYAAAANIMGQLFGASSLANVAGDSSSRACSGVSTPLTFGTWGDLTNATWTEVAGANASKCHMPMYKVA